MVCDAKANNILRKTKKLNKRKDKIEAWMADEILATLVQKNKMYINGSRLLSLMQIITQLNKILKLTIISLEEALK